MGNSCCMNDTREPEVSRQNLKGITCESSDSDSIVQILKISPGGDASNKNSDNTQGSPYSHLRNQQFEDSKKEENRVGVLNMPSDNLVVLEECLAKGLDDSSYEIDIDACTLRVLFDCIDQDNDGKISTIDLMDSIAQVNSKLMSTEASARELHIFLEKLVSQYSQQEVWTLEEFTKFMHDSAVLGKQATPEHVSLKNKRISQFVPPH